uniref:RNA-directed RNA polymerase L n=1 Tax=Gainesville rodent jeilong virus 1 TaxID=3163281 RepID=A0AAU7T2M7_9MONO
MTTTIQDILYPECHLNSPIVTGKLVSLLLKAKLPYRDSLDDKTIEDNLRYNIGKNSRLNGLDDLLKLNKIIHSKFPDFSKLNPIPYPFGNKFLFRLTDKYLTEKLDSLLYYADKCYKKINNRLVKLRDHVQAKMGTISSMDQDQRTNETHSMLHIPNIMSTSRWYNSFKFWFTLKYEMRKILKKTGKFTSRDAFKEFIHDGEKLFIVVNKYLCVIIDKLNYNTYYSTFEMILMFSDVLEGRLMIDTAMTADIRFKDFRHRGYNLWEFLDSFFEDLGNDTYNLVAMIEPLVLGFLQLKDESILLRGAFLDFCFSEIENELISHGFDDPRDIISVFDTITNIFHTKDIHMISEFFSFFRTFGHPTLEAKEAAEKVRTHMNKPKLIQFEAMMKGHAIFCGIIINGYRERHGGSWPPHTFPDHVSEKIRNLSYNSEALTHEECILNWRSFVGFKFKCFMPLTLDEDLTMYMKDKALAAIRSEWDSVYPKEFMKYIPPTQTTSRRLVEVFLQDSDFDPVNLIDYVISGEYLNDEQFNLSYSLKEKEIKKVGRLFAKMTYRMRACQVVGESLIATGVGKYFKENGMVKDEHELLKTLHKLSVSSVAKNNKIYQGREIYKQHLQENKPDRSKKLGTLKGKSYQRSRTNQDLFDKLDGNVQYETISTFLTTDLQKFCLNWRQETTNLFAQRLNEIYGLPQFFNWLHKRLERSVLYVADPFCPPNLKVHVDLDQVDNDQIFIKYPMGGIEGYCQKMWTIITIPFLFLSAYECGAKIAAVVQGDNQAIAITKRVHPNLPYNQKKHLCSQLAQQYFNRLRMNMAAIGHNLKANETIVSSHFFVYSKRIYYDGLVLSQALKPMSRAVFWSETLVDETRSACSNICTAVAKSIEQGFNRWIGYCIMTLKTLQQIIISLKMTLNDSMTADVVEPLFRNQSWLIAATLIPSQLGGFGYLNMCRLYVRNIGDPVTASLADVKRMIKVGLLDRTILHKIMFQDKGTSNFLDWASDPYAVNIPSSQSVTTMLKNITSRMILQNSDNPMLAGLFHTDFEQEDHDLASFLMDRPIIIPRAAHEIMDKSLTGARQEIAGMLDSTKGLIRNGLLAGGLNSRLTEKLSYYDYEQFRVFNNLMKIKEVSILIDEDSCSVDLARRLREIMWMKLARGRPIYGLEVPDIIEAMNGFIIDSCSDCYYCQSQNKEFCWFFIPSNCELDQVHTESNSIRVPYFGSTTDERSEIKLSSVRSASRALKAAIRIATVYTWAYGDDEKSWAEAWYLATTRANLSLDELKAITPISTSNNIAHRLRDRSTTMKYSGSSLNRVSRYTMISNDNLNITIDDIKVDTNLVYQQVMLLGLSTLEDVFRYNLTTGDTNTVYHLHIEPHCCIIPMEDHPYVESKNPPPVLQFITDNRLIYDDNPLLDKEVEIIHNQMFRSSNIDFPRWSLKELNTLLAQSLAQTLIDVITRDNKDHLTEFKVLSNDDDINSMITEFLLVDPNELAINLGLNIAVNWSYDIYYKRPLGKYQMSEFICTSLKISSHSYLNVLINALSHPQVFRRFWDTGLVEPSYGPNLSTQDFISLSIDFLIKCYEMYLDYWLDDNTLDYILTESKEEIVDQRFEILQSKHLCMLCCLYLQRSEMPKILGLTSIEKCAILTEALQEHRKIYVASVHWNLEHLPVVVYPASLTYIRRGSIKHIRLRQAIRYNDPVADKKKIDPLNFKSFVIMKSIEKGVNTSFRVMQAILLFSDDFRNLNGLEQHMPTKNRWENHVRRRIGINSTSCYKAVEIGIYLMNKVNLTGVRLFLGEGSGAMLTTYYLMFGQAKCYYNSGVINSALMGQRVHHVYPSEAMLVAHNNPSDLLIESNIKCLFNGKPESTWIGDMRCFSYIMNTVEASSISFIHNDMESSMEKTPDVILCEQIHSMCLAINLGCKDSVYVTKIAPRPNDYTYTLINLLYEYYNEVNIFLPSFSNQNSSECYIICTDKKFHNILYPHIIYNSINRHNAAKSITIANNILDMKFNIYKALKIEGKLFGDYLQSDLVHLDEVERALLSYGFQINGPKLIRQVTGHDIASGCSNLRSYINSGVNNLINYCDPNRDKSNFLDPYPLQQESKMRELMKSIGYKMIVFILLHMKDNHAYMRREVINNLRRKILQIDLLSPTSSVIIQDYLFKKLTKLKINLTWRHECETSEVKVWWKIVGYSLIYEDDN